MARPWPETRGILSASIEVSQRPGRQELPIPASGFEITMLCFLNAALQLKTEPKRYPTLRKPRIECHGSAKVCYAIRRVKIRKASVEICIAGPDFGSALDRCECVLPE